MADEGCALADGGQADEATEQVMALLDGIDPLSDDELRTMSDEETVREFEQWLPSLAWCAELGCTVSRSGPDGYAEDDGDARAIELMRAFNSGRWAWALREQRAAREAGDGPRAKLAAKWAEHVRRAQSSGAVAGAVRLWKQCNQVRVSDLNREPGYLGTPAGVVDMAARDLVLNLKGVEIEEAIAHGDEEASPSDNRGALAAMVTKRTRGVVDDQDHAMFCRYDRRWDEFVLEIMDDDEERAGYLQRALGYSAYGGNPEEVMFVAYGATTRNGKGTLLNSVVHALGDYAAAASPDFLLDKAHTSQGDKDEVAMMAGKRLVTISEPPEGRRLDESKVKQFTGNDPVTTSRKYGRTFTYEPEFTLWMMCNALPTVSDTSVFASGRVRVIPFDRHFAPEEQDSGLKARFRSEVGMSTILNWLLAGYEAYLERGLDEPASVRRATAIWAGSGGDDFRRFLDERCERGSCSRVSSTELMAAYRAWCDANDADPLTAQKVTKRLAALSVARRKSNGKWWFYGLAMQEGEGSEEREKRVTRAEGFVTVCHPESEEGATGAESVSQERTTHATVRLA